MKRFLSLIAAAAVCLSMTACGEKENVGTDEAASNEAAVTEEVNAATADADAKTEEAATAEAAAPETADLDMQTAETIEAPETTEATAETDVLTELATELALEGDGKSITFTMPADMCVVKYLMSFDDDSMLSAAVLQVFPVDGATFEDISDSGVIDTTVAEFVEKGGYWEAEVPAETFGDESMRTYDSIYEQFQFMYQLYQGMMDYVTEYTDQYADLEEGEYIIEPYFCESYFTYDENDNEIVVLGLMVDVTTRYPNDEEDYVGPEMTVTVDGETMTLGNNGYSKMGEILTYYYDTGMEDPFEFETLEIVFEGETYTYAYADIEDRTGDNWGW